MAEFGAFLGPALANAGQTFQNYYDDRIRKKREEQVLGLQMQRQAQQDQFAVNQDRREQQRFDFDMQQAALPKPATPKYKSLEELETAIISGVEPDPTGDKMKAIAHHRSTGMQRDYKPSEFELYKQDPQGYEDYKSAGRAPLGMKQRMDNLFPNGRFVNPYPGAGQGRVQRGLPAPVQQQNQPVLGNPPAGGNSGLIRLPDGSELTPEEYQMAKAAGLI